MDEENSYDNSFETVVFDEEELLYRAHNGEEVNFPKLLHVRFNGEVFDAKLSFTTGAGGKRIPCLRIDGARINLDDESLEIAVDCIIPLG